MGPRLLLATMAVVLVGAGTAWLVAGSLGPRIFHQHMVTGQAADESLVYHAEWAFRDASTLSLSLALLVALTASVAVSLFLTRRVTTSLTAATTAARAVATGDHSVRVPHVGMGREFDELAEALNTTAADLAEVEATRTRMLGNLAHEMRTPLAILDGYLQAINDGVRDADEETVALLRDQVTRLTRLGEDIAVVTTAEEGRLTMHRRPVTVTELLDAARAQAQSRYRERDVTLTVEVSSTAEQAVVEADPDRLGQVLTNLLDNALRHTAAGGHVELAADRHGAWVSVHVSDDGEGIGPEHLPHLFDRFYRADTARDRTHGGSGVGLAIVRAITRAHGGTVTATSAGAGAGSTFTITIPAAPSPARG
ncbi:sensor histidine kinase [Enemella sp. A6]|uniref:sensor histidine kinase n=1 Tax=Enemella sp. A6 TaxID=3440152 RepID=UPI003EBE8D10